MTEKLEVKCDGKDATIKTLRYQIRIMQQSLERKNKALDAMHYVWCDGGCYGGVHRYTDGAITEDIVAMAERNVSRLRKWYENNKLRNAQH